MTLYRRMGVLLCMLSACGGGASSGAREPTEASPTTEVSFDAAYEAPEASVIRFEAWVWAEPAECAACPEDGSVACEACFPENYEVGAVAERAEGDVVIELELGDGPLPALVVGGHVRLTGEWSAPFSPSGSRTFIVYRAELI